MMRSLITEEYAQIGRVVHNIDPDLANRILSILITQKKALCYNLSNIPLFLKAYCSAKGIEKTDINGIRQGKAAMYLKHVFIAAVIKLYDPSALEKGIYTPNLKRRLRSAIGQCLGVDSTWVSQNIPIISTRLKVYKDFEEDVEAAFELFKNFVKNEL